MIGYHASHEQFPPGRMLEAAKLAKECGFEGITCSDHFNPWSHRQGESGFALSWLNEDLEMGFSTISLHNVNREQERFIRDFGSEVLRSLSQAGSCRPQVSQGQAL
jgi:alkanesulfonate monooxygenase SsuD/methylene tetrahydromethanopterin reductase-like flavin-dependent oxidoreductase (luciferase family)